MLRAAATSSVFVAGDPNEAEGERDAKDLEGQEPLPALPQFLAKLAHLAPWCYSAVEHLQLYLCRVAAGVLRDWPEISRSEDGEGARGNPQDETLEIECLFGQALGRGRFDMALAHADFQRLLEQLTDTMAPSPPVWETTWDFYKGRQRVRVFANEHGEPDPTSAVVITKASEGMLDFAFDEYEPDHAEGKEESAEGQSDNADHLRGAHMRVTFKRETRASAADTAQLRASSIQAIAAGCEGLKIAERVRLPGATPEAPSVELTRFWKADADRPPLFAGVSSNGVERVIPDAQGELLFERATAQRAAGDRPSLTFECELPPVSVETLRAWYGPQAPLGGGCEPFRQLTSLLMRARDFINGPRCKAFIETRDRSVDPPFCVFTALPT